MGSRGPAPKRSTQRRRQNKPTTPPTQADGAPEVEIPKPHRDWHPVAKRWFTALSASGQSAFYEPSDWATAYLLAESISRSLRPQFVGVSKDGEVVMATVPPNGSQLAGWLKGMTGLMVTEADRRRMSLELSRPKPAGEESADVSELDEYRRRIQSG